MRFSDPDTSVTLLRGKDMCPECKEALVAFELEGVELDHCVNCKGIWLDAGELEMFLELSGQEPGGLTQALRDAKRGKKHSRRCPRCNRRLRIVFHDGEDGSSAIELDECPLGHGLWFDHGEILALVRAYDKMESGEEGLVARFFTDLFRHTLKQDLDT